MEFHIESWFKMMLLTGDIVMFADIDENADCANIPGGYNCTCKTGYPGNGTTCEGKYSLKFKN